MTGSDRRREEREHGSLPLPPSRAYPSAPDPFLKLCSQEHGAGEHLSLGMGCCSMEPLLLLGRKMPFPVCSQFSPLGSRCLVVDQSHPPQQWGPQTPLCFLISSLVLRTIQGSGLFLHWPPALSILAVRQLPKLQLLSHRPPWPG